jgi:hypothetical protein
LVLGATTGFLALLGGRVLSSSSSALWPLIESPDAFQLGSAENVMYLLSDLGIAFAWIAGPLMASPNSSASLRSPASRGWSRSRRWWSSSRAC